MSNLIFFNFGIFHQFFVLFKLPCLVTLFDRKLQVFQKFAKLTIVGILSVNVACFARNIVFETFGVIFKHCDRETDLGTAPQKCGFKTVKEDRNWPCKIRLTSLLLPDSLSEYDCIATSVRQMRMMMMGVQDFTDYSGPKWAEKRLSKVDVKLSK